MSDTTHHNLEEYDIRKWFMTVDLTQAYRVIEGIIQTRREFQPKRKRRSDAGTKRDEPINLKEVLK